jgi:hypothetical protein
MTKTEKEKITTTIDQKLLSVALAWVMPSSRSSVAKSVQYPSTLPTSTHVCQRNN